MQDINIHEGRTLPMSNWTKELLLLEILNSPRLPNITDIGSTLRALRLPLLKDKFLRATGWDCVSPFFNTVTLHSVDHDFIGTLDDAVLSSLSVQNRAPYMKHFRDDVTWVIRVSYPVWGSRGKRRFVKKWVTEDVVTDGVWAFTSVGKKKLSGSWIKVIGK